MKLPSHRKATRRRSENDFRWREIGKDNQGIAIWTQRREPQKSKRDSLARFRQAPLLLPIGDVAKALTDEANSGNEAVSVWLGRLVDEGPTAKLEEELEYAQRKVEVPLVFVRTSTRNDRIKRFCIGQKEVDCADEDLFAFGVVRLIFDDYLDRLHRCVLQDCRRYFTGDPRRKWCSPTCGTKWRMRAKRRRDRQ